MEYLDGDTLASRLERGPMPLPDVVRFGAEIAAALDAAHRQRLIHRDLKPANVMLTRSGVKLLDFGLAKAMAAADAPQAPGVLTVTNSMTVPGTVLGTVPYMSPEQIEGREADARSDIFALGVVLYEMATGRRAFAGNSSAGVASAILSSEPPPIGTSPSLDRIVRGCLRKDPDRRWQSAQDVALQLGEVEDGDRSQAAAGRAARSGWLPWVIAGVAAAGAFGSMVMTWRLQSAAAAPSASAQALPLKFTIPVGRGDDAYLALSVEHRAFAISPDGQSVAMAAGNGEGPSSVWIRALSLDAATMLPGTEGATSVFWSPDGRSLGFFALGKLKRVDLPAGAPVTLCDVRQGVGYTGTWGDGQIVFAPVTGDQILSVPAAGGQTVTVLKPNPAAGEDRIPWPSFLPDGRRFLYLSSRGPDKGAVMLYSPDGKTREVLPVRTNAAYVEPGFLIYGQDGTVLARRFDPATGQLSGEPIALAEGVTRFGATGLTHFSVSRDGAIVVHSGTSLGRVIRVDRQGRVVAEVRGPSPFEGTRLSRDGRELFADSTDPATSRMDIWKIDLERGGESRITSEVAAALNPVFERDGTMIYSAARAGPPVLYRRPVSGPEAPLLPSPQGMQVDAALSPDGRWLIYSQRTSLGNFDLMVVSMADRAVTPFHQSPANEGNARFSPDGRFVSFSSNLAGRPDVYVAPFPGPGPARIVSTTAGTLARWSADGRELFYVGADGTVYAAAIANAGGLQIGKPQVLFTRGSRSRWISYDPTSAGQFIALEPVASAAQQPLRVILNWQAAGSPH
jgi:Tol biopolymer transport system component